jgi:hypothetical protein
VHLALVKYSVLRLALFVASLVVLYAVGVRESILMVVLAAFISLALSYLLLRKQRDAVALALSQRISSRIDRRQGLGQSDADAEDADDEAARAQAPGPETGAAGPVRAEGRPDRP